MNVFEKILEWDKETRDNFKDNLEFLHYEGMAVTKPMAIALKFGEAIQVPARIVIRLGDSLIHICKDEVVELKDIYGLINEATIKKETTEDTIIIGFTK